MKRIRFLALLAVMIFAATGVISKAASMSVDASFSDWENVKKHQASGNLSEVAMVVNGDRVYVYAKEGNGMNSAISWGQQLAFVTNADPGSGLLFFQNVILPFKDEFPKTTELYRLLTTKPSEVSHGGETG